jgi:hypothetical protein
MRVGMEHWNVAGEGVTDTERVGERGATRACAQ